MIRYIATAIATMTIVYLFGAFIAADFDIRNWVPVGRFFVAVAAFGAGAAVTILRINLEFER